MDEIEITVQETSLLFKTFSARCDLSIEIAQLEFRIRFVRHTSESWALITHEIIGEHQIPLDRLLNRVQLNNLNKVSLYIMMNIPYPLQLAHINFGIIRVVFP